MKIIINACSVGEKLWPLTSKETPKGLLPMYSHLTMLEETISRIVPLVEGSLKNLYIITTNESIEELRKDGMMKRIGVPSKNILGVEADTDVGYLLHYIADTLLNKANSHEQVVFLPADHFYFPDEGFVFHIDNVCEGLENNPDKIVLLTMQPGGPASNVSYVQVDWSNVDTVGIVQPTDDGDSLKTLYMPIISCDSVEENITAEKLVSENWLWDLKTFIFTVGALRNHITEPKSYEDQMHGLIGNGVLQSAMATRIIWSIVDNWPSIYLMTHDLGLLPIEESPDIYEVDSSRVLVRNTTEKEIFLIGVDSLIVINTEDKLVITTPEASYEYLS